MTHEHGHSGDAKTHEAGDAVPATAVGGQAAAGGAATSGATSTEGRVVSLAHIKQSTPAAEQPKKAPRIAWPGGKCITNKDEAIQKFLARKSKAGHQLTEEEQKLLELAQRRADHIQVVTTKELAQELVASARPAGGVYTGLEYVATQPKKNKQQNDGKRKRPQQGGGAAGGNNKNPNKAKPNGGRKGKAQRQRLE